MQDPKYYHRDEPFPKHVMCFGFMQSISGLLKIGLVG
jgi:hypothetical protein